MPKKYKKLSEKIMYLDDVQNALIDKINSINLENEKFNSIDHMIKALNYYIRISSNSKVSVKNIEDILLCLIVFSKFASSKTIMDTFWHGVDASKITNGLNRLVRKGYIRKTSHRDVIGKSLFGLTEEGWNHFKQFMHDDKKLIPYSELNYSTDGIAFHDSLVGIIFVRLLLIKVPFIFSRHYYLLGTRKANDVYPDAIVRVLPSSMNERAYFIEGDTGTEGVEALIEKIGKYCIKKIVSEEKTNYIFIIHQKNDDSINKEFLPYLFDSSAINTVYELMAFFNYTLDELIYNLAQSIRSVDDRSIPENLFRELTLDKNGNFINYKYEKALICAKSIKTLLKLKLINNVVPEMEGADSDIKRVKILINYCIENKYSNQILNSILLRKNKIDVTERKIAITKGIFKRCKRKNMVLFMTDTLSYIFSGAEIFFTGYSNCEKIFRNNMKIEYDNFYCKKVKKRLSKIFNHEINYVMHRSLHISNDKHFFSIAMRNCFWFIDEKICEPVEIYVENISYSLSALVRATTLINNMMDISHESSKVFIICMVETHWEIEKYSKFFIANSKKGNHCVNVSVYFGLISNWMDNNGMLFSIDADNIDVIDYE